MSNLSPEIVLQIAVLFVTGLNAWTNAKTTALVSDLKALMYKEFVTKSDLSQHLKERGSNNV